MERVVRSLKVPEFKSYTSFSFKHVMERVIRASQKRHNFLHKFVTLVSLGVPTGDPAVPTLPGFIYKKKDLPTQPPTLVCKMEAQSEHVHVAYTGFLARLGADSSCPVGAC